MSTKDISPSNACPLWDEYRDMLRLDMQAHAYEERKVKPGPNEWENITPEDFGEHYDYEIYDQVDRWIYYPVCNAALQWCYRFLPEETDRWQAQGFIIPEPLDSPRSKLLRDKLWNDGLKSEWDRMSLNQERQ